MRYLGFKLGAEIRTRLETSETCAHARPISLGDLERYPGPFFSSSSLVDVNTQRCGETRTWEEIPMGRKRRSA